MICALFIELSIHRLFETVVETVITFVAGNPSSLSLCLKLHAENAGSHTASYQWKWKIWSGIEPMLYMAV